MNGYGGRAAALTGRVWLGLAVGARDRTLAPCTLTGPSCDSQDTILDEVWLPAPRAGDRVLIGNAGAYTTCYSGRSAFNGYPAPTVRIRAA